MVLEIILAWLGLWAAYESLSVVFMSEWYPYLWLYYMPIRVIIWPSLALQSYRDVLMYYHHYGRLNLWWR